MSQNNSIYKGIVIQNDDPIQGGRVKVFIPHLHLSLINFNPKEYSGSVNFGFFGKNINEQNKNYLDLTPYLEDLKAKLPWCNVLQPIVGETGGVRYNPSTGESSISDNDDIENSNTNIEEEQGGGPGELYNGGEFVWNNGQGAGGNAASSTAAFNTNKNYNAPKGSFAIPSVNTQVWVMFVDGNVQVPLVVGVAPTPNEVQSNLPPSAYPAGSENVKGSSDRLYRNSTVVNSGASTVVTNNTVGNRSTHQIHHSGTSHSTNNDGSTSTYVTSDANSIIAGSSFTEIKGGNNSYVEGQDVTVTRGDRIKRVGSLNVSAAQSEKETLKSIDDFKSLFEIKRSAGGTVFSSSQQSKAGTPAKCPECSSNKERPAISGESLLETLASISPIDPSQLIPGFSIPNIPIPIPSILPIQYPPVNLCKVCGGKGESPGSMDGEFEKEDKKEQIGDLYVESAGKLSKTEQDLGEGGNDITEVTKNMVISVGLSVNNLNSVRVDPEGKVLDSGIEFSPQGPYTKKEASPLIEPKHVDDLSGGTFTLLANNKASFFVGAGGLKIQSLGISEISGTITKITGEQVNISSGNEVNIGGGKRLSLEGKIVTLKGENGQVFIDGNLSVKNNLIVQGGAFFNGPVAATGISTPMILQPTEELVECYGISNDKVRKIIGYTADNSPVYSMSTTGQTAQVASIRVYGHRHWFRGPALDIDGGAEDFYNKASQMTSLSAVSPIPPKSGKQGPEPDLQFNSSDDYARNLLGVSLPASFGSV